MDKRLSTLVVIALMSLVLLAAFYLGNPPNGGQVVDPLPLTPVNQESKTLVVWGSGKAVAKPEGARFYVKYRFEGRTAEKALIGLNQNITKAIGALGGFEKDGGLLRLIRQEVTLEKGNRFWAVAIYEVTLDEYNAAPPLVDRILATGATLDGAVQPLRGDLAGAKLEAFRRALEDAKVSAQAIATGMNKQISDPLTIEEGVPQEAQDPMSYQVSVKVSYRLR